MHTFKLLKSFYPKVLIGKLAIHSSLKLAFVFLFLVACTLNSFAQSKTQDDLKMIQDLEGSWTIDLRPNPDAPAYLKEFKLKLTGPKTFTGEFYDSKIMDGLLNTHWEKVYFAFTSRDQSNDYFHSGYLLKGKIYGTTYCPQRDFITPWIGTKKD